MYQTVRVAARLPFAQPGADDLAQDFEQAAWMLGGGEDALVQQRVAVIVLGMHRSGTSAMARLLSLLGCALPATLMPGRGGNEHGHWESEAICAVNDALLAQGGCDWTDWRAVAAGWGEDWLARGRQVLRAEFGGAPLFVMKDPRQCRLLPFWLEVLAQEGIAARVVMALRHPWEVAQSLARRDGMSAARAHLLWLAHLLEGEVASRGRPRVLCAYDRVMEGAQGDLARDLGGGTGRGLARSVAAGAG